MEDDRSILNSDNIVSLNFFLTISIYYEKKKEKKKRTVIFHLIINMYEEYIEEVIVDSVVKP